MERSSVAVAAGASIIAAVNVTTDNGGGNQNWRSTGWRISTTVPGSVTCVNHPNHDGSGTYSETLTITAPSSVGTYNVVFHRVRERDMYQCSAAKRRPEPGRWGDRQG